MTPFRLIPARDIKTPPIGLHHHREDGVPQPGGSLA
eukprot:gene26533-biopygen16775